MSSFARRFAATLLAAPLLVSPLALSSATAAQTSTPSATTTAPGSAKMSAAPGTPTSTRAETVEQRITSLHSELKITPAQEKDWDAVAQAMRENANSMQQLVDQTHGQNAPTTALDDLDTYQKFAQGHADGVKNLITPFTTLYNEMSDTQKKNADQVFNNFRAQAAAQRSTRSNG
jgi:protein CpxP